MSQAADRERREVYFEGEVQGVGFRYTAQRVAAKFAVTGYVRNLPDGRVLLVAEGHPSEVDRFLAAVGNFVRRYVESVGLDRNLANC
jgi:acylphosphatase